MKHQNLLTFAGRSIISWRDLPVRVIFFVVLLAISGVSFGVDARVHGQTQQPRGQKPAPKKVQVAHHQGRDNRCFLEGGKAKMTEIAADLSKRLGAQVIWDQYGKKALTVEFYDLPLNLRCSCPSGLHRL